MLEVAYVRRMKVEARIQAIAIVEVVAQVLGGEHGMTADGKVFERVSTKAGLARMGISI